MMKAYLTRGAVVVFAGWLWLVRGTRHGDIETSSCGSALCCRRELVNGQFSWGRPVMEGQPFLYVGKGGSDEGVGGVAFLYYYYYETRGCLGWPYNMHVDCSVRMATKTEERLALWQKKWFRERTITKSELKVVIFSVGLRSTTDWRSYCAPLSQSTVVLCVRGECWSVNTGWWSKYYRYSQSWVVIIVCRAVVAVDGVDDGIPLTILKTEIDQSRWRQSFTAIA